MKEMIALYIAVYIVGYVLTGLLLVHLDRGMLQTDGERAGMAVLFSLAWPLVLVALPPYFFFKWAAERMG